MHSNLWTDSRSGCMVGVKYKNKLPQYTPDPKRNWFPFQIVELGIFC